MRRLCVILGVLVSISIPAMAGLTELPAMDGSYSLVGSVLETEFTPSTIGIPPLQLDNVTVFSAAYSNGTDYLYAYQVVNGNASKTLHRLTLTGFLGLENSTETGYFTANPAGFIAGGAVPTSVDIDAVSDTAGFGFEIAPSGHSAVMYVASILPPGEIYGLVQNGGQAYGLVVGPVVPEPATLALLAVGGLLVRKRK